MLERIIALSLDRRGTVLLVVAVLAVAGIYAAATLPLDAFPDVTNIQVEVLCEAPGLSALEIERLVTQPVEMTMRGLPGITQLRSVTKYGLSVVTVVFDDDVDIYFARQLVFERLGEVNNRIPPGLHAEMGPVATAMGEVYQFTLAGPASSDPAQRMREETQLRTLVDWTIAPLLKAIPGVNEINAFGGYLKQYQIAVSPQLLQKYGLTVNDVVEAVERNNENVGGGTIDRYSEQMIVRGVGLVQSVDDLRSIVLRAVDGTPITLADVADVSVGEAVRQGASLIDGRREAVGGIVMMTRGENGMAVVRRVRDAVREIHASGVLPRGVVIRPYYDRSDIVGQSIRTVVQALLEGSVLVLLVLLLLLRSVRGAIVVLLALPLSLLVTFIVMKQSGLGANLMSLGGLAISIGMIIDATIIQVENVQRLLVAGNPGQDRKSVVLRAVLEVRRPSILGELVIATTFLPILSLAGLEGKMFTPLALAVVIALLASLLLSVFVIPTLCLAILRPHEERESAVMRAIRKAYVPVLSWCLAHRRRVLGIAIPLFAAALLLSTQLGSEFIPVMDEGAFDMDVQLLPGVSLPKALETTGLVAEKLKRFPELKTLVSRTGQTGIALEARGIDNTGFTGVLAPRSEWTSADSREDLMNVMRDTLAQIPGIAFSFSQPIQCRIDELVAGTKAQLIVKIFGDDRDVLARAADDVARVLSRLQGAADVVREQTAGQPYLTVTVDRSRVARHGLNVTDVLRVVEIAIGGKAATQVYEEGKVFDAVVRFPAKDRSALETIGALNVATRGGYSVPLDQLADVRVVEGPVQVSRENGLRRVGIELNVSDRDIGGFVAEAKAALRRDVRLPEGYYASWGGQFENQERATRRLLIIAPVAIGLIMLLLFLTFRSARLTGLVMITLPFSLIGGVFALFLSGQYLSVPASIGFIVLFGVAVLNGLVLVSHIAELRSGGLPLEDAVRQGCADRLRPVLMTAIISVFSLLPMLVATGPGSEIQRPLAAVVVGGLITSTLLTLLVTPVLYGLFEKRAS
jgi:heavy metal efflux system protein